ncbi:MAG: beta-galactosidase [Chloroflexi bacterium]|nr:beta-galactosidase [Chloroflexota bacterium]
MAIPRSEYPRPQFVREDWLCLNGEWEFEIDQGDSGLDRGLAERPLNSKIIVPFCPESELSGINNRDYLEVVWYRKQVTIPAAWGDKKVLLHFQACDYDTTVWVNGVEVGRHRGGSTPFSFPLTSKAGETIAILVRARDSHLTPQPRGKQSRVYGPFGPIYYRTTGIWQTVWLEPVPTYALKRPRLTPDVANSAIHVVQPLSAGKTGLRLKATLKDDKGEVVSVESAADADFAAQITLPIPEDRRRLWSIPDPFLYDLDITLLDADGTVIDTATSYAGLRSVTIEGKAVKINGEIIFQRLVLDQGYYPDGILTAPNDEALKQDIVLSMEAGFNGARLHQKVFEERFLYYADKLGYLVWGEFPDWGVADDGDVYDHQRQTASFITEWLEELERDYSHPAIIGWCPLNETWQAMGDKIVDLDVVTRGMFLAAKAMDTTRPVLDTSGYSHRIAETDVYDSHDYEQDVEKFRETHAGLKDEKPYLNTLERRRGDREPRAMSIPYGGQPYFVSEFGGIWWNPNAKEGEDSWGYGNRPKSLDEFYARFEGLFDTLLDDPNMFAYCYTQLTDVYQEQNGVYTFDRKPKFDMDRIRAVQLKKAAIEKSNK